MKVYLKCDKNYNGKNSQTVDASWVRGNILEDIILIYMEANKNNNPILNVTEEVVDYYNYLVGGNSCKSAQSIAKNLRVQWIQNFADKSFANRYCRACGVLLKLDSIHKEFEGEEEWLECPKCGMFYDLEGNEITEDN